MYFDWGFNWGGIGGDPILALNPLFYTDYTKKKIDAVYAAGSAIGTFSADRTSGDNATKVTGAGNGEIVTVTDNLPRFVNGYYDISGYHAAKGLMLERASTNLVPNYLTWQNLFSATVGDNTTPFGAGFGFCAAVGGFASVMTSDISVTNGLTYHVAVYLKKTSSTVNNMTLGFRDKSGTPIVDVITSNLYDALPVGVWVRHEASFTYTGATATGSLIVYGPGVTGYTWEVGGAQMTELPHSTTIPSGATPMLRNAEALQYQGTGNYNTNAGTIALAFRANMLPKNTPASNAQYLAILNSGGGNAIILKNAGAYQDWFRVDTKSITGGGTIITQGINIGWNDRNELHTAIFTYSDGVPSKLYLDGVLVGTAGANYVPLSANDGVINVSEVAGSQEVIANYKSVAIFGTVFEQPQVTKLDSLMKK